MTARSHLAFCIRRSGLVGRVLIPKYYDPDIATSIDLARGQFRLVRLGDILLPGDRGSRLGTWIRRDLYGTGDIPSDLSHWRIRPDFKKGVSRDVFERVRERQDIQPGDLLMVAHGTYLIGTVAIVTPADLPLVLQDHVFRLRVDPTHRIDPHLLLVGLSTAFVRRQIRSKQFSADIIDKIGERHLELMIPLPSCDDRSSAVAQDVRRILAEQDAVRSGLKDAFRSTLRMSRERSATRHGFTVRRSQLAHRILVPKYYDPVLEQDLRAAEQAMPGWVSIGDLLRQGLLHLGSGVEVGKMAYGTGDVPFVRTSDIVEGEIKLDTKHGISPSIYEAYERKAGIKPKDILLVRDGTYLVGSSALVSADDCPALICGGLLRLRTSEQLDPYALFGLLNTPLVKRQMRARQFTRDVIDTLGRRLLEVRIPDPSGGTARLIAGQLADIMSRKALLKRSLATLVRQVEPQVPLRAADRPGWSMR
jgi:hypothetical protein